MKFRDLGAPPRQRDATPLPLLLSDPVAMREARARALATADRVVFEAGWRCHAGEPADGGTREVELRPEGNLVLGRLELGLSGRTQVTRSRLLRRRARRVWSDGSVFVVGRAAWVPADCWTERVFAEAGRRLYMRTCAEAGIARALPAIGLPNRWQLLGADGGSRLAAEVARMRAQAENEAFERWTLSATGRRHFERFGRDPDRPLA